MSKSKIGNWEYDDVHGTWAVEDQNVKISLSLWNHQDHKNSHLARMRWEHNDQHFATHLKLDNDNDTESLLMQCGMFVTEWLKEQHDNNRSEDQEEAPRS